MVGQWRRLRRRRAVARRVAPVLALIGIAAVVAVLVAGTVSQIAPASGSYRRTVDRGFTALADPLATQSNGLGARLTGFLHDGTSLSRMDFFDQLDSLASSGSGLASEVDAITPPQPVGGAGSGCASAMNTRSRALSKFRGTLEGLLGGRTGTGQLAGDEARALTGLESVGGELEGADTSWEQCRTALLRAPGTDRLATSSWVGASSTWSAGRLDSFVSGVEASTSLISHPALAILSVVTEGASALASGGQLLVSPTTSLGVDVVVQDPGNVDEPDVKIAASLAPAARTAPAGSGQGDEESSRLVPGLRAGGSVAVTVGGMAVRPGSSYELHVTSTSGAANSGTVSIALQVEQAVSTTVVLASVSPVEVGQVVTYSATATSSVTGLGAATGTMMFQDDGNTVPNCGARPVRNGRATCSVSYPAKGAHALIALYSGDSDRSASTSVPLIENVSPASRRSTSVG